MAIYKSFWALNHGTTDADKSWSARTLDIGSVESWEYAGEEETKVFMKSGDTLIIKFPTEEFGDLVCAFIDGYGKLFTFNNN